MNESKSKTPKYTLNVTGHVEFILSQAEEWAREKKVDAKAVVDEARENVMEMLDSWLEQQIPRKSDDGSLLESLDSYAFVDRPECYDDHEAMIDAHEGEFYNFGWGQGDNFITSKTSVGVLHTEVDADGNVAHLWLPYEGAEGFPKDIKEPIPATFPETAPDDDDEPEF